MEIKYSEECNSYPSAPIGQKDLQIELSAEVSFSEAVQWSDSSWEGIISVLWITEAHNHPFLGESDW